MNTQRMTRLKIATHLLPPSYSWNKGSSCEEDVPSEEEIWVSSSDSGSDEEEPENCEESTQASVPPEEREIKALESLLERTSKYWWPGQSKLRTMERMTLSGMRFAKKNFRTPQQITRQRLKRGGAAALRLNPVARALLAGARDEESALGPLGGLPEVVEQIFRATRTLWAEELSAGRERAVCLVASDLFFPKPTGIDVNMMPFVFGDKATLPAELHGYWNIIQRCRGVRRYRRNEEGNMAMADKIVYLTVQESVPDEGCPQRRGGIHTEGFLSSAQHPGGAKCLDPPQWHHWGMGVCHSHGRYDGGVFMASNISGTCRIWDAQLPREPGGCSHTGGDAEHLRGVLTAAALAIEPSAGEMYWMTDATPHESLPLPSQEELLARRAEEVEASRRRRQEQMRFSRFRSFGGGGGGHTDFDDEIGAAEEDEISRGGGSGAVAAAPAAASPPRCRQYFRLVTSDVSVWWARHSTPNPLGTLPPPGVRILHHSKFDAAQDDGRNRQQADSTSEDRLSQQAVVPA